MNGYQHTEGLVWVKDAEEDELLKSGPGTTSLTGEG